MSHPKPEGADGLAFWEHLGIVLKELPQKQGTVPGKQGVVTTHGLGTLDQQRGPKSRADLLESGWRRQLASPAHKSVRSSLPCWT